MEHAQIQKHLHQSNHDQTHVMFSIVRAALYFIEHAFFQRFWK